MPKSIFRQPGAKHFQLVHRSQRDPLINDPEASTHVLKPIERENSKKGKSKADLESTLSPEEISAYRNIGEASLYGVYYDDAEYDYMQHLRTVGVQEDGVESILIEAPLASKRGRNIKPIPKNGVSSLELPEGVLASTSELPRNFESQQAIPDSIAGFQPDMDPHLRQVLEALDEDAYVDDNLHDEFFQELVVGGERGEDIDIDFREESVEESGFSLSTAEEGGGWEKRFSAFKMSQKTTAAGSDDGYSDGDTLGSLPTISVLGAKKRRRKISSDASGYSMSSSSMYRNEALQTLDERFDQIMLNEYNEKDDKRENMLENDAQSDEAPELITSRDDFDSMVNEFLNDYEILGRKMEPKFEGETGPENLNILRQSMGQEDCVWISHEEQFQDENLQEGKEKWDCETILTTYTNLENHPRLIRARDSKTVPKIKLDRRTGLPVVSPAKEEEQVKFVQSSDESAVRCLTITRPRDESKEEKKARKTAVKQEKQTRRIERKSTKEQFSTEMKDHNRRMGSREQKLRKL